MAVPDKTFTVAKLPKPSELKSLDISIPRINVPRIPKIDIPSIPTFTPPDFPKFEHSIIPQLQPSSRLGHPTRQSNGHRLARHAAEITDDPPRIVPAADVQPGATLAESRSDRIASRRGKKVSKRKADSNRHRQAPSAGPIPFSLKDHTLHRENKKSYRLNNNKVTIRGLRSEHGRHVYV